MTEPFESELSTAGSTGSSEIAGRERELFDLLADNAREVVTCHDSDLTVLYASPAAYRVLGFRASELIGRRLDDFAHPDDLSELLSSFAVASEAGQRASALFRCRTPDLGWRWCEIFCRGVTSEESTLGAVQATIRDVSKYKRIEKAIERVAKEWRTTFDSANDAIIMLDAAARIMRVNRSTLALFDCSFEDLIGQPLTEVAQQQLGLDDPFDIARAWRERTRVRCDVMIESRDVWFRSAVDIVRGEGARIDGAVVFVSDITKEKSAELRLRASLQDVRDLSAHLQTVREEERRSIAREVHDELGHALTALKMDIAWLTKRLPDDDECGRRSGQQLSQLVDQTIQVVRRIVSELRPPVLDDLGLAAALEWLGSDFRRYNELKVELDVGDLPARLRGDNASAIFRIVQEALTNVSRHAEATTCRVRLFEDGEVFRLRIEDDGRGFDCHATGNIAGFGLLGISERVRELGGSISIESEPGSGTRLLIELPRGALS